MLYAFLSLFFSVSLSANTCSPTGAEAMSAQVQIFEDLAKACVDQPCGGKGSETNQFNEFEFNALRTFLPGGAFNAARKQILEYASRKKCPDECFQYNLGNVEAVGEPAKVKTKGSCQAEPLATQKPTEYKSPEFTGANCEEVEDKLNSWNNQLLLGINKEGENLKTFRPKGCTAFYATTNVTAIHTPSGCKGVLVTRLKFGDQEESMNFKASMRATHRWVCAPKTAGQQ
jgi:hypothetical protein